MYQLATVRTFSITARNICVEVSDTSVNTVSEINQLSVIKEDRYLEAANDLPSLTARHPIGRDRPVHVVFVHVDFMSKSVVPTPHLTR